MKKTMIFMLLCTAMAFAFTACETSGPDTDDPAGQEENNGGNGGNGEENPDGEDNPGDDGKVRVRKLFYMALFMSFFNGFNYF